MSILRSFVSETSVYGLGNVASRVLTMLLIPLYAANLGKTDYSNLVLMQSSFSVLAFLLALNSGVFFYYYATEEPEERKKVFSTWFYYQLFVGLILIAGLILLRPFYINLFILNNLNTVAIQRGLFFLSLQFLPYIVNITNINLCRIDRKPLNVIKIVLSETVLTLLLIFAGFRYLDFDLGDVLAAQLISRCIVSALFSKMTKFYINYLNFELAVLRKLFAFSWPFFFVSSFTWIILSIDKFIGAQVLADKDEVAYLALAMQLSLPIAILADMIRMSIGPFFMSIYKEDHAASSYQSIFDLSVFAGTITLIGLVGMSPVLTILLSDRSYLPVVLVIPLIAMSSVLSLAYNQLAIGYNLSKNNVYILYATVFGGTCGVLVNYLLMPRYGFIVSGIAQILSYCLMCGFLLLFRKKKSAVNLNISQSGVILIVGLLFSLSIMLVYVHLFEWLIQASLGIALLFALLLISVYFKQHNITLARVWALRKKST